MASTLLHRYSIRPRHLDDWLTLWPDEVRLRERHGFRCLFAVSDEPKDLFTWAFDFEGKWDDLVAAQRPYYADAERVQLRRVFDHMADYSLDAARPLGVTG